MVCQRLSGSSLVVECGKQLYLNSASITANFHISGEHLDCARCTECCVHYGLIDPSGDAVHLGAVGNGGSLCDPV